MSEESKQPHASAPAPARNRRRTIAAAHPHVLAVTAVALVILSVAAAPLALGAARGDSDADGRWELLAGPHGVSLDLMIDIHGDEVTGRAPCNGFRADWSTQTGPSNLQSSAALCRDPEVMAQEHTYYRLFGGATSVEVTQAELRLSGPSGSLTFRRRD